MNSEWRGLFRVGGAAALALLVYSLATMVQLVVLGGAPATASEAFRLLENNRVVGLLRLDLPTALAMPLYCLLFLGLFAALRQVDASKTILATALALVGVTLVLASPTALSMIPLSDKYAAATTEEARMEFRAAGEAMLAADAWHGTGAFIGGILLQAGCVLISVVMLRGGVFGKATAILGILTHGLDLAHIVAGLVLPSAGVVLMAVSGPLYPIWFFLVGRRLWQMSAAGSIRPDAA